MRLRGPITPGLSVYASSMLGPLAGVNFSVSVLFLGGLTLNDGLLLAKQPCFLISRFYYVVAVACSAEKYAKRDSDKSRHLRNFVKGQHHPV